MSRLVVLLVFTSSPIFSVSFVTGSVQASRVCLPGPPLPYPSATLKNCLIIGDSVSIGYSPWVRANLSQYCQVQHAPWDRTDGGALDTKYGLECLSIFLNTTSQEPTKYDAIVFNFGLHDVNYNNTFPEEYTPIEVYMKNLGLIKEKLLKTGAQVGFVTSTPIPYNRTLNDRVKSYNIAATKVMRLSEPEIRVLDLYSWVVMVCGPPPYNECSIARKQPNPHYTTDGYKFLAQYVTALFVSLLRDGETLHDLYKGNTGTIHEQETGVLCKPEEHHRTSCPLHATCIKAEFSVSGYGCCLLPDAVDCGDGRHCCPDGMACDQACDIQSCRCIERPTGA